MDLWWVGGWVRNLDRSWGMHWGVQWDHHLVQRLGWCLEIRWGNQLDGNLV